MCVCMRVCPCENCRICARHTRLLFCGSHLFSGRETLVRDNTYLFQSLSHAARPSNDSGIPDAVLANYIFIYRLALFLYSATSVLLIIIIYMIRIHHFSFKSAFLVSSLSSHLCINHTNDGV